MSFQSRVRIGRSLIATTAIIAAGFTASSALTATNTVPATQAGEGTGVISGYTVSNVSYTTSGNVITAVDFELDGPASTVEVKLDSSTSTWYTCTDGLLGVLFNDYTCDTSGTEILIGDADELRVVAVE